MEIYLIDPYNMYFYRNREYIPSAYPVYPYSENQLYILLNPMFHTKNNLVIIIMHIYIIIINVLLLLLKKNSN